MTDVAVKYLPDLIVLVFAFLMILFGTGSVYLNMERNKRVDKYVPTFIFLLMCLIFCVLNMGCTNHPSGAIVLDNVIPVPDQPVSYNLVDFGGTSHRYERIFLILIFRRTIQNLPSIVVFIMTGKKLSLGGPRME